MTYFLLAVNALLIVLQRIFQQRYNAKCNGGVFFFSGMISFFAMCFFALVNRDWSFNTALILPAIGFGLSYAAATVFAVLAIRSGSLAKTTLIISYSLLIPALSGYVVLKEPIGAIKIVAFALLVISLWLTNHKKSTAKTTNERVTVKWIVYVLLSFIGNGMCATVQKLTPHFVDTNLLNDDLYMCLALGLSTVILLTASLLTKETEVKSSLRISCPLALFCGLFNGAANYLAIYLNQFIPASVMFPVLSAGEIVLVFIYSLLVCRERFNLKQWMGFIVGVISIVMLNL